MSLKPYNVTADNIDDLRIQLNNLLDTMWSVLDQLTGNSGDTLKAQNAAAAGNVAKVAVEQGIPAIKAIVITP
jgi:hypothetical protein